MGASTVQARGSRARPDGGATPETTAAADFLAGTTVVDVDRFTSRGHAPGRWDVEVWANEAGARALRGGSDAAAQGARVVALHFERAEGGSPGPVMVMQKEAPGYDPAHGDWRYIVVTSAGSLVKDGPIVSCLECHEDAPHDHLFRLR